MAGAGHGVVKVAARSRLPVRVSRRHDTVPSTTPVNAHMTTKRLLVLALATAAFGGGLAAQAATTLEAQLARAALLETQGNLAEAEQELLAAAKLADAARAGEVDAALRALRQRTGRASPGVQDPTAKPAAATGGGGGGDPIQTLLATLEVGSDARPEVEAAIKELRALGALAVPPLLAALPKLGPFGARNVATLLYLQDDPRILPVLRQRIAAGEAAFATMLASDLGSMPRSWSVALARDLAARELPAKARFAVLQQLVGAGEEREWQPLLDSLDPATDLHWAMLEWHRKQPSAAGTKLLVMLQSSPSETVRAAAVQDALLADPRCSEEQALQALDRLSPASAPWVASKLVEQHPSWVRVGLRALARTGWLIDEPWFRRVEWWRLPDEAAPALLSLPVRENHSTEPLLQALEAMAAQGWRAPAELDEKLRQATSRYSASMGMSALVNLVPEAGESRALAIWEALPTAWRRFFVDALVAANRPWHRVVLAQLAAVASAHEVNIAWVARDWTGLSPESGLTLVAEVTRLLTNSRGSTPPWTNGIVTACSRQPDLPTGLLAALVRADNHSAFHEMAKRDPQAAFTEAASAPDLSATMVSTVAREVARRGDKQQLPLAIRLVRTESGSGGLGTFFTRHGAGEPSVIELGKAPWPSEGPNFAAEAIKSVRAEHMVTVLTMLPDLAQQVAQNFMNSAPSGAIPRFSEVQRSELSAAIERLLPRLEEPGAHGHIAPMEAMCIYVSAVGKWGDPSDMPLLRRISAASQHPSLASSVAVAMLGLAGPNRTAVLAEMLDSKNVSFAIEALRTEDLRTNADLRQHALQAVLLLGPELPTSPFDNLQPADALAMAKTIVDHPGFASFHSTLAGSAVGALGATKDEAMVPIILRGASHPYPGVRRAAVEALGNICTESAARALLEMLRDEDGTTRNLAKTRLDQIGEYLDARAKWDARKK